MTAVRRSQIDHDLGGLISISVTVSVGAIVDAETKHHAFGITAKELIHHRIVVAKC